MACIQQVIFERLEVASVAMPGKAYIGTSGWNYKSWRDGFYGDTPQKEWLRFCAEHFTAIEINGALYKLSEQSTFRRRPRASVSPSKAIATSPTLP
jgi:hypothetical protein